MFVQNFHSVQDAIIKVVDISIVIKILSSNHAPVRHASASLLLELSKCKSCCYKIGTVAGGILMLITVKYRQSTDAFASETADQILKNLEILPDNIKLMAENGYWEPLLAHLVEGNTKILISSCNKNRHKLKNYNEVE